MEDSGNFRSTVANSMTVSETLAAPQTSAKNGMKSATGNLLKNLLKIAFAAGLIYWLIHKDVLKFSVFARLATPGLVAFGMVSIFLQIYLNNYRWLRLLRGQGFESTISRTMPLSLIGMFFNFAMPGGVGGDVVKGYFIVQDHPRQKFAAAMSIFMDRMMGFFVMIATAFCALFFNWSIVENSHELKSVAFAVAALFLGFLVFFFLSLSRLLQRSLLGRILFEKLPGGSKIKQVYEVLHSYRRAPRELFVAALMSVLNQVLMVLFFYVIAQAIGVTEIPWSGYFFLVPVGTVVQALPISPAGIGVGQAAFYFLFKFYLGHETELGPTAITTMQIMNFCWGLVGAYFYVRRSSPKTREQIAG